MKKRMKKVPTIRPPFYGVDVGAFFLFAICYLCGRRSPAAVSAPDDIPGKEALSKAKS